MGRFGSAFLRHEITGKQLSDLFEKIRVAQRPPGVLKTPHQLRQLRIISPGQMFRPRGSHTRCAINEPAALGRGLGTRSQMLPAMLFDRLLQILIASTALRRYNIALRQKGCWQWVLSPPIEANRICSGTAWMTLSSQTASAITLFDGSSGWTCRLCSLITAPKAAMLLILA